VFSASVLDRLNALLEPNGLLVISERGVIDGSIPTIKPHPDFRCRFDSSVNISDFVVYTSMIGHVIFNVI